MGQKGERKIGGELLIAITAILWSTGGLFLKLLPEINAFAINGMRSFIALIVILIYFRKKPKINKWSILGGIIFSLVNITYVFANKLTTSANAIVLQETAPIYILIMTSIATKKAPRLTQIAIMVLAIVGIVLVFSDKMEVGNIWGNVLALLGGVFFAGVFFMNNRPDIDPIDNAVVSFALNSIIAIPFIFTIESFGVKEILPVLGLGVLQFGLPYITFSIGIKKCSPFNASIIALLEAILNPIWVFLVIGEKPGMVGLIGCVIVIVAIVLNIVYDKKRNIKESKENAI